MTLPRQVDITLTMVFRSRKENARSKCKQKFTRMITSHRTRSRERCLKSLKHPGSPSAATVQEKRYFSKDFSILLCLFIAASCITEPANATVSRSFQTQLRTSLKYGTAGRQIPSFDPKDGDLTFDSRIRRSTDELTFDDDQGSGYPDGLSDLGDPKDISTDYDYYDDFTGQGFDDLLRKLYKGPVCALVDVRNTPDHLSYLENCTIVNGFVHMIFMHQTKESDFEKYTFPKLRVITQYLLIYRVYGLRSLRRMFPNLTMIGGKRVFFKYGLVIYENPQLQELGLGNLRHIARGGVRIQKNGKLCYLETVDWKRLGMLGNTVVNEYMQTPVIKDNAVFGEETCLNQCGETDDCTSVGSNGKTQYCWGHKVCQKPACPDECPNACRNGKCECHAECLGGCTAPNNASACMVCYHKYHDGVCVPECPEGTYLESDWRCVTSEWCHQVTWYLHDGKCVQRCPPDHIEHSDATGRYFCKYCGKNCRQDCTDKEYLVTDSASIPRLYGCTSIPGRLVINILGGDDLLKALEEALLRVEEVGSLSILRSESLVSLDFLRNLKRISGSNQSLVDGTYSLYVLDNANLRTLFPATNSSSNVTGSLRIDGGKAFFHFNPKLCVKEIEKASVLTKEEEDDEDISKTTNGDRATCDMLPLKITNIEHMPMTDVDFATVRVKWEKVELADHRTLIGYQIYYRESKFRNATRFEGLYACGKSSSWIIKDKLIRPNEENRDATIMNAVLHNLKPFTQYALYVRAYTTSTAQKGAQSNISYFVTEPGKPSEPIDLKARALNSTAIVVDWKPPLLPNGNITHYIIRWRRQREDLELIRNVDMCKQEKTIYPHKNPHSTTEAPNLAPIKPNGAENKKKCCSCGSKEILPSHEEEVNNNVNFENFLQKSMLRKHYLYTDHDSMDDGTRRRRSLDTDVIVRRRRDLDLSTLNETSNSTTDYSGMDGTDFYTPMPGEENYTGMADEDRTYGWYSAVETESRVVITELHHFSEYEIQVYACNHASIKPIGGVIDYSALAACSIEALTSQRAQRLPDADVIPQESFQLIEHQLEQERIQPALKWEAPSDPNGYIKSYDIEIQQEKTDANIHISERLCFSLHEFERSDGIYIIPIRLPPGPYRARVSASTLAGKGDWTEFISVVVPEGVRDGPIRNERYVWIVAIAVVFIIAPMVALSYCYYKRKKKAKARKTTIYSSANPEYVSLAANYIPDGYEVDENDVELVRLIGHGNFGKVFVGFAKKVIKGEEKTQVAVKKLHEKSGIHKRIEFLEEAKLMKAFNSTHVVRLLGVVSQTTDPMVIMEYMEKGDLKSHLRSRREDSERDGNDVVPPPTLQERLEMAAEIADGMAYLAEIKYVHRDLAARNCLVSEKGVVKIGDFGLTRDVYETDYYRKDSRGLLPIRWMAPESLRDGFFDSQSDVWSYGVVLWEIATLAEQPYQGRQHDQVTRYVIDGGYMEKPKNCPKKLYDLMLNCWQFNPEMRPKFMEILTSLSNDVTERFKQESYYFEQKRAKLNEKSKEKDKRNEEEISLLNGDAFISREGSFRILTPLNTTPTRSRSETPCGCHTPASRSSNGSAKISLEILPHCDHLKKISDASSFNLYLPCRKTGGIVHSGSTKNKSRKAPGCLRKSESFPNRENCNPSPHPKKTPPSTLTRRSDDAYYSLSTSGIEDDFDGTDFEEATLQPFVAKEQIFSRDNTHTTERQRDISYATLSDLNQGQNNHTDAQVYETSELGKKADKPYEHMNGFVKRHDSTTKRQDRRQSNRRTSPSEESSYVESGPQSNSKYFESNAPNHIDPLAVPSPPSAPAPPPFPPPNRPRSLDNSPPIIRSK